MANSTRPLTNTEVKNSKAKLKDYSLADGSGLYLRVRPNGSKLWIFNYAKPFTKKRTNLSLGSYPELSLSDARERRSELRKLLAANVDPKSHRERLLRDRKLSLEQTFEKLFESWLEVKKSTVSKDYALDVERAFRRHILPNIGKLPIEQVDRVKVISTLKPIESKGARETVRRLCQKLNEIMVFAANSGLIESNPLSGIQMAFKKPQRRNLPALKPTDLPDLLVNLSNARIKMVTRCLIEWQLHTMVRPGEAAGTRWEEIDFENNIWRIPAQRMKSNREHLVPLTKQALHILNLIRPVSGNREFVFPSDKDPKKHIHEQTANMALKRHGYAAKLVAHGFRSIASTTLNEEGFDPFIIEAALAHKDKDEVRNAYNRTDYLEQRRKMMRHWSDIIESAAAGNVSLAGQPVQNDAHSFHVSDKLNAKQQAVVKYWQLSNRQKQHIGTKLLSEVSEDILDELYIQIALGRHRDEVYHRFQLLPPREFRKKLESIEYHLTAARDAIIALDGAVPAHANYPEELAPEISKHYWDNFGRSSVEFDSVEELDRLLATNSNLLSLYPDKPGKRGRYVEFRNIDLLRALYNFFREYLPAYQPDSNEGSTFYKLVKYLFQEYLKEPTDNPKQQIATALKTIKLQEQAMLENLNKYGLAG